MSVIYDLIRRKLWILFFSNVTKPSFWVGLTIGGLLTEVSNILQETGLATGVIGVIIWIILFSFICLLGVGLSYYTVDIFLGDGLKMFSSVGAILLGSPADPVKNSLPTPIKTLSKSIVFNDRTDTSGDGDEIDEIDESVLNQLSLALDSDFENSNGPDQPTTVISKRNIKDLSTGSLVEDESQTL